MFVTNFIASPDGNGDRQVVTINKLRFVATKVADILTMVANAVGANLDDEPQLVTEDLGLHLPPHMTLTDAGLPNRARLCLVPKEDVAQQPQSAAAAADSPQPRLLETKTLPLSPPAAVRPADSSSAADATTVRDTVKAQQRQAQEACGSSRVTALDVVVQHAKGRPVYRLTRQQGGLGNMSVGAIKHMVLRFAGDVPVEHQRLFIGNRMRRDDELLDRCLADEERTGQVVACARLFRHTLTASVTFDEDSQEFQIHELSPESDTVYTVREALHSARGELRQSYKGFDAMSCVLRVADGSSISPLSNETPLDELRSTEDGGVVAFSVQLAAKGSAAKPAAGRRGASPSTAPSPQARAPTSVSVGRLDPSPRYNKAAPRDVSVVVVTEDTETISIGSPARARPRPKKAVPPPPRRRPSSTIGGDQSQQPTPREPPAEDLQSQRDADDAAPAPSPPPPPPLPPSQREHAATPQPGTPSHGVAQATDAPTPAEGGSRTPAAENRARTDDGTSRAEEESPGPHVEVIDEPTNAGEADEGESDEPPLIRTVATTSTVVLSSRVIQADLVERQRARRVRDSLCNEHNRRREDLLEASRQRLAVVKEKTVGALGLPRRPSNSRMTGSGASTPPPPQTATKQERRPSHAASPAHAATSPAPSSAVADRSALMSISPPRDDGNGSSSQRHQMQPQQQRHHQQPVPVVDTRSLIARIKAANARGVILGDPSTSRSSSATGWGEDSHLSSQHNGSATMSRHHHDAMNVSANLGGGGPVMLNLSA